MVKVYIIILSANRNMAKNYWFRKVKYDFNKFEIV